LRCNYTLADEIAISFCAAIIASMLTAADLQTYIGDHNIPAEIVRPPSAADEACATVSAAAQAMGVCPDMIIKSVLFVIRRTEPLLVIVNGERRIDQRAIASRLGIGKGQVKTAKREEVLAWTGYPVGGVPPFGHLKPIPTWIDSAVLRQDTVYGGGGQADSLVRLPVDALISLTDAEVVPVCS